MIETVKLNEVMNAWPAADSLEKIAGLDSAGIGNTLSPDELLSAKSIVGKHFSADGGMKYATFKHLGYKRGDGKDSTLLVCAYDNSLQSMRGIMGRIYALRGNANSGLIAKMWDVLCIRAYSGFRLVSTDASLKSGRCLYGGKNYLAIQLGGEAYFDAYFTGVYSGNCVFIHVLESEVTWI